MLAIVVDFRIHPAHVADFREAIVANARQSLADEPGCHRFDVCDDPNDASRIYLYELYDDDDAFCSPSANAPLPAHERPDGGLGGR